jgi:hypothetical protein
MKLKLSDFEPTKGKLISTVGVYLALLLSSFSKVVIYRLFYPSLKSYLLERTKAVVDFPDRVAMKYNAAVAFYLVNSAVQFLLIYLVVCVIYVYSKRDKK